MRIDGRRTYIAGDVVGVIVLGAAVTTASGGVNTATGGGGFLGNGRFGILSAGDILAANPIHGRSRDA
jgi:hypothetical protein